jgi:hypothetical protein
MTYGGIRNPILRTESGVSLLVGYRLDITKTAISHIVLMANKSVLFLISVLNLHFSEMDDVDSQS